MTAGWMTKFIHWIGDVYLSLTVSLPKIVHIQNLTLLYSWPFRSIISDVRTHKC